ncbi:MAG: sigma-70 family RNA polymerase sigma factor [Phycisphaerales bacterium]
MITQTGTHASLLARLGQSLDGGADAAWREFVDRYGELIRGFCRSRNVLGADCDDVVQEVLLSLAKAMPGFRYDPAKGKFRSYLKTVTLHAIFRKSGQKHRGEALADVEALTHAAAADDVVDATWEQEWRRYHLRRAMQVIDAEFSSRDRAAFSRYAVAGEDGGMISKDLGISMDALYQIKTRITRRLAQVIEQQVQDEG